MVTAAIRGFRLVRKLGEGPRAEVFLARCDHVTADSPTQTVVLKLFRETVAQMDWLPEIEALDRAKGPHVVAMLDIAQGLSGRTAIILERLETGTLTQFFGRRDRIVTGEAITITAPLVETVDRLHAAGVSHGSISTDSVLFSQLGAPTLARFGSATIVAAGMPPAHRAVNDALAGDVRATLATVGNVLARVESDREVASLRDWLTSHAGDGAPALLPELAARLFDLGEPQAVRFAGAHSTELGTTLGATAGATAGATFDRLDDPDSFAPRARIIVDIGELGSLGGPVRSDLRDDFLDLGGVSQQATTPLLLPGWLSEQLNEWMLANPSFERVRAALARRIPPSATAKLVEIRRSLRTVRPRVWIMAAVVTAALIVAGIATSRGAAPDVSISQEPDEGDSGGMAVADSSSATESPVGALGSVDAAAISSGDPLRALDALLAVRERCIRDLSVLCLDAVAQSGSSALADDQELILGVQAGGELPALWAVDTGALEVVERLGDSVLVSTGEDATGAPGAILLMKGEAGWRLRDYLP